LVIICYMLCRPILPSLGGIAMLTLLDVSLTGAAHQQLKPLKLSLNNNQPVSPELGSLVSLNARSRTPPIWLAERSRMARPGLPAQNDEDLVACKPELRCKSPCLAGVRTANKRHVCKSPCLAGVEQEAYTPLP
jgi:hypothetical protein